MKWILGLATGNPWGLAIAAAVLMSIGAAGGWKLATWRAAAAVAAADRETAIARQEFSDYQIQAAAVITQRLQADLEATARDQAAAVLISQSFQEGKRANQQAFQPVLEDLAALRTAAAVWSMRDAEAARHRSSGEEEDAGTSRRRADACEERLRGAREAFGEVAAAAEEVARAGSDAGDQARQLTGAINYIHEVCESNESQGQHRNTNPVTRPRGLLQEQ